MLEYRTMRSHFFRMCCLPQPQVSTTSRHTGTRLYHPCTRERAAARACATDVWHREADGDAPRGARLPAVRAGALRPSRASPRGPAR